MEHNRVIYEKLYDSEIEYLESTGTQWIDTDCIPNKNTGFYFDGVILSSTLNRPYNALVFGAGVTDWTRAYVCYARLKNDRTGYPYNDFVIGDKASYDAKLFYDTRLQFSLKEKKLIATDGTTISVSSDSFSPLNDSMLIFGVNFEGSPNYLSDLKIYNFKIYDNNTLIRDFIPVRKGSTGYMYDKVSKKLFANQGTGNFILGNDVANPVPNIRRVFRFGNKRFVIPCGLEEGVDYQRYDWLKADIPINTSLMSLPINSRNFEFKRNMIQIMNTGYITTYNNNERFSYYITDQSYDQKYKLMPRVYNGTIKKVVYNSNVNVGLGLHIIICDDSGVSINNAQLPRYGEPTNILFNNASDYNKHTIHLTSPIKVDGVTRYVPCQLL